MGGGVVYPNISICEDKDDYDLHLNDIGIIGTYVEIGGIKWATKNIGADSVTDYGQYFQWGDISGYTAEQVGYGTGEKAFTWEDYKYNDGTTSPTAANMTKYNATDGKTVLDLSDDGVYAAWGGNWRTPTTEQFVALGAAVNTAWTTNYMDSGVSGLICTDKIDSNKVLFFPAAGYVRNGVVDSTNGVEYWSKSLYSNKLYAYMMWFNNNQSQYNWQYSQVLRRTGFLLRGILVD